MCHHTISIVCPHCSSSSVVKNGRKPSGKQNFLCKGCRKQFQHEYTNRGADPRVKRTVVTMLCRNCGIRDIAVVMGIGCATVLSALQRSTSALVLKPSRTSYGSVQIDEVWSYVHRRKKGKYWLLYAYAPENDEVLAFVCGSRSRHTVRKLYSALAGIAIAAFCTDSWKAFREVFPSEKHRIGKAFTKHIEGVNTSIRARNRRFVRKTTCFSKKKENHEAALRLMFAYRNSHHTF